MTIDHEDPGDDHADRDDDIAAPAPPHPLVALDQRRHLSRILRAFLAMVVLLPLAGLGGGWSWLLLPLVLVAGVALREAMRLRRSVRTHGNAAGHR